MNLYLIYQKVNANYDTYDSAVVAAASEEEAKWIHPEDYKFWDGEASEYSSWCNVKDVKVDKIGLAKPYTKKGIILASFNAG